MLGLSSSWLDKVSAPWQRVVIMSPSEANRCYLSNPRNWLRRSQPEHKQQQVSLSLSAFYYELYWRQRELDIAWKQNKSVALKYMRSVSLYQVPISLFGQLFFCTPISAQIMLRKCFVHARILVLHPHGSGLCTRCCMSEDDYAEFSCKSSPFHWNAYDRKQFDKKWFGGAYHWYWKHTSLYRCSIFIYHQSSRVHGHFLRQIWSGAVLFHKERDSWCCYLYTSEKAKEDVTLQLKNMERAAIEYFADLKYAQSSNLIISTHYHHFSSKYQLGNRKR